MGSLYRRVSDTRAIPTTAGSATGTCGNWSHRARSMRSQSLLGFQPRHRAMTTTPATLQTLAIHGGAPVRANLLPYGRQSVDEADIQAVVDVLRSDWLTTGPKVAEFEEAFASYVGARYAVSFSSGTA